MKTIEKLTDDKFKEIYTNKEFRNQVAYAHGCYTANNEFKYLKTCSYPAEYIVTEQQSLEALEEIERDKTKLATEYAGKLVFIGMGSEYPARYEDDVCNHRIRTEFMNPNGHLFFIELGTGQGEKMRCDHSIDRKLENEKNAKRTEFYDKLSQQKYGSREYNLMMSQRKEHEGQPYYNYAGLEKNQCLPKYTLQNVLKLVNEKFECNFKEILIDNYTLGTDDLICKSPK